MTYRAKPAVKRTHRPTWESDSRRNLYTTIGFGLVVLAALAILGAAAGASWYGEHLSAIATVNGVGISKDDLRDRIKVEQFRIDHTKALIRTNVSAGRTSPEQADQQINQLDQLVSQVDSSALEELIDAELKSQLARDAGITVTDADIDAKLVDEATTNEYRHVWVIDVTPEVSDGATEATAEQKTAARQKADKALAELKAGKAWDDVAKELAPADGTAPTTDLGWRTADDTSIGDKLKTALFAAQPNTPTDVIESDSGSFQIGRVTDIAAAQTDANFQGAITGSGASLASYRKAVRADIVADRLEKKVVADLTDTPTLQRRVSEIYLAKGQGTGDEVKASHILYSPNDDPSGASSVPADDPAWKKAEDEARAAYDELKKDPSKFEELARTQSDDTTSGADGGNLGFFTQDALVKPFADAIFAPGLTPGQILEPVKTDFGWHIIKFVERRADPKTRIGQIRDELAQPGADFAAIATKESAGAEAKDGGDLGWVARNQLDKQREDAIFAATIGAVTDVVETDSGYYLFKVTAEENRIPEGAQLDTLKSTAFSNWYAEKKKAATIERNASLAPASS